LHQNTRIYVFCSAPTTIRVNSSKAEQPKKSLRRSLNG
jgi:hypothetical protein